MEAQIPAQNVWPTDAGSSALQGHLRSKSMARLGSLPEVWRSPGIYANYTQKTLSIPLSDLLFIRCFSIKDWVIPCSALSLESEQMVQAEWKTNQVHNSYKMLFKSLYFQWLMHISPKLFVSNWAPKLSKVLFNLIALMLLKTETKSVSRADPQHHY